MTGPYITHTVHLAAYADDTYSVAVIQEKLDRGAPWHRTRREMIYRVVSDRETVLRDLTALVDKALTEEARLRGHR